MLEQWIYFSFQHNKIIHLTTIKTPQTYPPPWPTKNNRPQPPKTLLHTHTLSLSLSLSQTKQLNKTKTITTCTDLYAALSNGTVSTIQGSSSPTVITPSDTTLGHSLAHRLVQIDVIDIFSVPGDGACVVTFTGGAWIDDEA